MSVIFTSEYLATAPRADVEITYPDGTIWRSRPVCDGNGSFVWMVRDAMRWDYGVVSRGVELSRRLDKLRQGHAEAAARGHVSSMWEILMAAALPYPKLCNSVAS